MPDLTKTRASFYQATVFDFHPFSGFEVAISADLLQRYNAAVDALAKVHDEMSDAVQPFAEAHDEALLRYRGNKGLRLVSTEDSDV